MHPEFPRQTVAWPSPPASILSECAAGSSSGTSSGVDVACKRAKGPSRQGARPRLELGSSKCGDPVNAATTRMRHAACDGAWRERWDVAGASLMGALARPSLGCRSFPLSCHGGVSPLGDLLGASPADPPSGAARPSSVWPGVALPPLSCGSTSLGCSSSLPWLLLFPPRLSSLLFSPRL